MVSYLIVSDTIQSSSVPLSPISVTRIKISLYMQAYPIPQTL